MKKKHAEVCARNNKPNLNCRIYLFMPSFLHQTPTLVGSLQGSHLYRDVKISKTLLLPSKTFYCLEQDFCINQESQDGKCWDRDMQRKGSCYQEGQKANSVWETPWKEVWIRESLKLSLNSESYPCDLTKHVSFYFSSGGGGGFFL